MSFTYTKHAEICAKFYELTLNSRSVAEFVFGKIGAKSEQRGLFVGGMFSVAQALIAKGIDLTIVDYSDEMIAVGKALLPDTKIYKADLRALPFDREFDIVLVIGRVFTHMISNADLALGLTGCWNSLRVGGRLFADNYEDIRILRTNYFNGLIEGRDQNTHIARNSTTKVTSTDPFVVQWQAEYSGQFNNMPFSFRDSIEHRAFSRIEFASHLEATGFKIIDQGDNFDETSFYTLAEKM
jgi:ubiquinone/menaquinone biosynthesis C-methylase UbiE